MGPGRDLPAPAPSRRSSAPSHLSPSVCSVFPSLLSPLLAALSPGPPPPGSSRREPHPRLPTCPCAVSSRNVVQSPSLGTGLSAPCGCRALRKHRRWISTVMF